MIHSELRNSTVMMSTSMPSYYDDNQSNPFTINTTVFHNNNNSSSSSSNTNNNNSNSNNTSIHTSHNTTGTNRTQKMNAGPAFETAVASYASRVLKRKSPPESVIDSSVGPYLTSMLRSALDTTTVTTTGAGADGDVVVTPLVETFDEYDSMLELLEEHCNMTEDVAKSALQSIAKAVVTGEFDDDEVSRSLSSFGGNTNGFCAPITMGKYRSFSMGAENDYSNGRFRSLSIGNYTDNMEGTTSSVFSNGFLTQDSRRSCSNPNIVDTSMIEEEPSFLFEDDDIYNRNSEEKAAFLSTPLKPDRLIPGDLLGFIDDPTSPLSSFPPPNIPIIDEPSKGEEMPIAAESTNKCKDVTTTATEVNNTETSSTEQSESNSNQDSSSSSSEPANPKTAAPTTTSMSRQGNKKKKKVKDMDLAASLFTRPRSRSIHDVIEKSPKLKPMAAPAIPGGNLNSGFYNNNLDSAVQILMAMNLDICKEAATEAALVSNADVNVAQHVIDGAVAAPPVCRHMLNDGCYRSDCQFSHDVDGHTCLFWLKGRCGKHDCKFMHGFSEKLLDGVDLNALTSNPYPNVPVTIQTANLVQHNLNSQFLHPSPLGNNILSTTTSNYRVSNESGSMSYNYSNGAYVNSTPPLAHSPGLKNEPNNIGRERSQSVPNSSFSFASIASKGYNEKSSFSLSNTLLGANNTQNGLNNSKTETKTVRIPQNLWSPFYDRSSFAFHIADPLERYREVSTSVQREDVIDLHFQSIKTFPIVLSTILPEKLRDHEEVWVVTGSGHHVNTNSHQKRGGVLEKAVITWLESSDYVFFIGKDKNGYGGACLVQRTNR